MSGPDREGRPPEMPTVRTTIVGGRPPGSGQPVGAIPQGVEVLIKKAAVDPEFKVLLLEKRAEAAQAIGLALESAEAAMLNGVPQAQLEAIIAGTKVPEASRSTLVAIGKVAGVTLAALGVAGVVIPSCFQVRTLGHTVDRPDAVLPQEAAPTHDDASSATERGETGIGPPDNETTKEMPASKPCTPVSRGIRPDRPSDGAR